MIQLLWSGEYQIFVMLIIALVLSLTFHELGHAVMAKGFGDDTAERAGRMTLNPAAHIDPVGLLMVVIVGFGFAKPVPTNPVNFTSPRADLWVAAAGPLMNLLLALICWNFYLLAFKAGWTTPPVEIFFTLLAQINLLLMVFNLLPIGPLDGHYITPHLLPKSIAKMYRYYNARYGAMVLLALVVGSLLGLPLLSWLADFSITLLNLITLV
jgi:Zn-dependent protease